MSPIVELALVLALLFYLEGIRLVPPGTVAFSRRPWGGYEVRGPSFVRPGAAKGVLLPGLWAPALERYVTAPHPRGGRFDARRLRRRLELMKPVVGAASVLPWLLTANMFVLGPVLAQIFGWALVLPLWLGVHVILTALVVRICVKAARELPMLGYEARVETLLSMALYPPAAARFLETLTAKALGDVDPLCVAAVLLDREALARMARERLLDPGVDDARREEIEALLAQEEVPMETVLAPPARQSDSDRFCPRCQAQYRGGVDRCADCRDVALVPFA
ncbi:MAG TPA: hypothetical protein VMT33_07270 [Candidatus Bathyarchaeia archaeon]|nr:hypothetical protein [Candidatus Bathyarchaeia archaeon]